ncbi:MAG: hypothetical protein ACHQKY_09855 [Terriglobia bacterium]
MSQTLSVQEKTGSGEAEAAQKNLQKKAGGLLNEVVVEVRQLRAPENRIRFQAAVADLMWDRDVARSRILFAQVWNDLINLIGSLNSDDPQSGNRYNRYLQMRREVLSMISGHDAELALDFLRATRMPSITQPRFFYSQTDGELELEGNLANQIAQRDPRRALEIAEVGLAKGFSFPAINLLWQLRQKDSEVAARWVDDIVKKFQSDSPTTDPMALNAAFGLLQMDLQARKEPAGNSGLSKPPSPILNDQTLQWLVEWVGTAVTASNGISDQGTRMNRQNMLSSYQTVLPDLEKVAPSAASALRTRLAESGLALDDQTKRWQEFNGLVAKGSLEDVLQAAAKAPPDMQSNFYQQASWKALSQDDYAQARQIIRDHISDPPYRANLLSDLETQIISRMMNAGHLEQAHQLIYSIGSETERAKALAQLALNASGQQNPKLALQLVGEARGLLKGRIENQTQMNTQLELARSLVDLMANQAAEMLDPLTERINTLMTAAAELDPFEREENPSFQDGEMVFGGGDFLMGIVQNFSGILGSLAPSNFDRAKSIADQLQHPEARIEAHLEMVREILRRSPGAEQAGD